MALDSNAIAQLGSVPAWGSFFLVAVWIIRTWPHWKEKINEARKIQLDADGSLRGDLLKRIRELEEAQSADRKEFNAALSDERRRCDAELDEVRKRIAAAEEENRGLQAMIRQTSSSAAYMLGRPGAVAESKAGRARRGKGEASE